MAGAVLQHATGGTVQAALQRVVALPSSTECNDVRMVVFLLRANPRCVVDPLAFCRAITANMPDLALQARRLPVNVPAFEAAFAPHGRSLASAGVGVGVCGAGHVQRTRRVEQQEGQEEVEYSIQSRRLSNGQRYDRQNGNSGWQVVKWGRKMYI